MKKILLAAILFFNVSFAGTLQEDRWDSATLSPLKAFEANQIVDRYIKYKDRYVAVDLATGVPDFIIFSLHNMEAGGSFKCHLHEGSPLVGRTRYVPKGRPKTGNPPFTWEYSAIDALKYDNMGDVKWAYLDDTLYAAEKYNGLGYLKFHISTPSPYLWAGTSVERPGKYTADSVWSSTARSNQIGCVAIWKAMEKRGIINFNLLKR